MHVYMTRNFYCCKISYQWWWFQILFQRLKTKLFKFLTKVYSFSLKISPFLLFLVFVFETAAVYKISPKIDILLQLFQRIRNPKVFGNLEKTSVDEKWFVTAGNHGWRTVCAWTNQWNLQWKGLSKKLKSKAKALKPAGNRTPY